MSEFNRMWERAILGRYDLFHEGAIRTVGIVVLAEPLPAFDQVAFEVPFGNDLDLVRYLAQESQREQASLSAGQVSRKLGNSQRVVIFGENPHDDHVYDGTSRLHDAIKDIVGRNRCHLIIGRYSPTKPLTSGSQTVLVSPSDDEPDVYDLMCRLDPDRGTFFTATDQIKGSLLAKRFLEGCILNSSKEDPEEALDDAMSNIASALGFNTTGNSPQKSTDDQSVDRMRPWNVAATELREILQRVVTPEGAAR